MEVCIAVFLFGRRDQILKNMVSLKLGKTFNKYAKRKIVLPVFHWVISNFQKRCLCGQRS